MVRERTAAAALQLGLVAIVKQQAPLLTRPV